MLGIDFAVWLALLLSVASALLCVVYGLARWNVDDDSTPGPASGAPGRTSGAPVPSEGAPGSKKEAPHAGEGAAGS